jgi:predicted CoA-binding protein
VDHGSYSDDYIRAILAGTATIAIVGASADPARPSNVVLSYLLSRSYRLFPVNPGLAGGTILGCPVFARLADIREPIDMVDIFRRQSALAGVVDEALALDPKPKAIWMQLGLRDDVAAARAEAAGVKVVMNRCLKIEDGRFGLNVNPKRLSQP